MTTLRHPIRTRAIRVAAGLGALVVAFGVPATAVAYPIDPPSGEESESGGTPPATETPGAGQSATLPQTGSGLDGTLALGAGALIAGIGMSALAWRRRPLAT
jgi:LPXTG-motif cell wall-anchored protein